MLAGVEHSLQPVIRKVLAGKKKMKNQKSMNKTDKGEEESVPECTNLGASPFMMKPMIALK